jgi:hypothetical protein
MNFAKSATLSQVHKIPLAFSHPNVHVQNNTGKTALKILKSKNNEKLSLKIYYPREYRPNSLLMVLLHNNLVISVN